MSVASSCSTCFCVVPCVCLGTGHFVMVPLNLTYLHCLQHSFFEHLFNLYYGFRNGLVHNVPHTNNTATGLNKIMF